MQDSLHPDVEMENVALRAMSRAELRFSVLIDESFIIRWASDSVRSVLGVEPLALVGSSVADHIHADDIEDTLNMFAYEYEVDHASRDLSVRSVYDSRIRRGDGTYLLLESHISNHLNDPQIGMFLADCVVPSQNRFVDDVNEAASQGASIEDLLSTLLRRIREAPSPSRRRSWLTTTVAYWRHQ
jgi:PAS domain-containing protein